jgi:alcohol dehydrogenase class IV
VHNFVFHNPTKILFGHGTLPTLGPETAAWGRTALLVYGQSSLKRNGLHAQIVGSLQESGIKVIEHGGVRSNPLLSHVRDGIAKAKSTTVDVIVAAGGGSVIDTAKAANLYATYPADFLTYVNAPIGGGQPPPGPLRPHIACPTTSGTGAEVTGIAIFDLLSLAAKTGIASPALRPSEALIDPECADTLPPQVVAASGLDVLAHALESYTARPYSRRPAPEPGGGRPLSQGANPWSDIGCREALTRAGALLPRAVASADDREAREGMMWAATLAGIAFGNAGVHIPHGMSYAIAGQVRDYRPAGYPDHAPMVPHGVAVIVNAPAAVRFTAHASPQRHLQVATWLGADTRGAAPEDAGEILAARLIELMRAVDIPNGASGVGYHEADCPSLASAAILQQRLLQNAPCPVHEADLRQLFHDSLRYW